MTALSKKTIVIAGGGTGGHVYPGIAIARSLQQENTEIEIHFVGSYDGLENKIIPREKFSLHLIAGGKLNFSGQWLRKLKTILLLPVGLVQSFLLIKRLRPDFVLGVGGYASGPFVLAATICGCNTAIWEPNAWPGLANRWLSKIVKTAYVVFSEASKLLACKNIKEFGMPVRQEIEDLNSLDLKRFENQKLRMLCFGGSQGARGINKVLCALILQKPNWLNEIEIVHQIGSTDWSHFSNLYKENLEYVQPMEFIYDMPEQYKKADFVLCRGGASTLTEISASGLPALIVPLHAADNHQEHNAKTIVEVGGAVMIRQSDFTVEKLSNQMQYWLKNREDLKTKSQKIKAIFKQHAAQRIAQDILSQMEQKS
jgi:UDP-N-acetylglucosamine--N-acetylmuramyl-(pentapeptide) pyrophosphoryl-undecaprenol N-acetylglucosamine transferase